MHRESADDGSGLPRTGLTHDVIRWDDGGPAPQGGIGAGTRGEADGAGGRVARPRKGRLSAEQREAFRRADAFLAETRALLARLEAERLRPRPAGPPRLRVVGGTEWSGE